MLAHKILLKIIRNVNGSNSCNGPICVTVDRHHANP